VASTALTWAALIGVLGALTTAAFPEGMAFTESLATGHPGRSSAGPSQRA